MESRFMISQKCELKACTSHDAALLSLLAGGAFLEAFADELPAKDLLQYCQENSSPHAFVTYMKWPNAFVWTANLKETGVPVGYILTCEPNFPVEYVLPSDYELKKIYIFHRFHGAGVGRTLVDKAAEIARSLGRRRLLLGVYSKNTSAIRFYERVGFAKVGLRKLQVGTVVHDDFIFGREI